MIFFWLEVAWGTPYQTSLTHSPNGKAQGLSVTGNIPDRSNPTTKNVWRDDTPADTQTQVWLFPKTSASASAEIPNNELPGESPVATAVPEPPSMLLFAAALIGLASIGRKKFLKK